MAQDDAYKGPAKVEIKSFWRQAEMFKNGKGSSMNITNMQRALAGVKEKDPAYNISAMEEELKKWKAGVDKEEDAKKTDEEKATEKKLEEVAYNGPASKQVSYFWTYASKPLDKLSENELNTNIREMEYALKTTKEKDPVYNTSEMQTELDKFKAKRKEMKIARANEYSGDKTQTPPEKPVSNDPGKLFEELFEEVSLQLGGSSELSKAPEKIEKYKAKLTKLLSLNYEDAKIDHMKFSKANINGKKAVSEREIDKVDEQVKSYTDKESFEYIYYTMQYHLVFWDAAQKVFTEEASYKEMYQKVNSAVNKIGSLDAMESKAAANSVEKIKNTKLPKAFDNDPALEKSFMDIFDKRYGEEFKGKAIKAVVTSSDWTIERNEISGVVTGRVRNASIVYKGTDGKCYLINYFNIRQEYVGGKFLASKPVYMVNSGSEMLCENVK